MPVTSFVSDDLFVFRVIKSHVNNPDRKWANSYEFRATAGGDEGDLLDLGEIIVNYERALSYTVINFDRLLISTWSEDSKPYDPEAFISSTLTALGQAEAGSELLALNTCMSVTRQAASGRFGHLFYRGMLSEGQVGSPAGKSVLTNRTANQTNLDNALSSSGLDDYIGNPATGPFQLVLVNKDGSQVRPVINLRVQGVSTVPMDHTWFNRTKPPTV